jgi:3-methyladenine DNA glycosylase AlkC
MPEPLKLFFDAALIRSIASDLRRAHPAFRRERFVAACLPKLDGLELMERGWLIAEALNTHLPRPFALAVETMLASFGQELPRPEGSAMAPFRYLPFVLFVQKYGLEDFEPAMRAQYELTKRFSAEFSIRAFLERYPEKTYARLRTWAADPNVHVRRLVSEGTRPRLPWAPRLRDYQRDPRPVLALLELLKDDPELYVQRSVANNLNDIAKDHPDLAVETCRRWSVDAGAGRSFIIRHALRGLVKQGHRGALAALGVATDPKVEIRQIAFEPARIELGGAARFRLEIVNTGRKRQSLVADYAVHYVKANGTTRPKVFKLRQLSLAPGERVELGATISFKDLTTRKHYPGRHRLEARISGVAYPLTTFDVVARPQTRVPRRRRAAA